MRREQRRSRETCREDRRERRRRERRKIKRSRAVLDRIRDRSESRPLAESRPRSTPRSRREDRSRFSESSSPTRSEYSRESENLQESFEVRTVERVNGTNRSSVSDPIRRDISEGDEITLKRRQGEGSRPIFEHLNNVNLGSLEESTLGIFPGHRNDREMLHSTPSSNSGSCGDLSRERSRDRTRSRERSHSSSRQRSEYCHSCPRASNSRRENYFRESREHPQSCDRARDSVNVDYFYSGSHVKPSSHCAINCQHYQMSMMHGGIPPAAYELGARYLVPYPTSYCEHPSYRYWCYASSDHGYSEMYQPYPVHLRYATKFIQNQR